MLAQAVASTHGVESCPELFEEALTHFEAAANLKHTGVHTNCKANTMHISILTDCVVHRGHVQPCTDDVILFGWV